MPNTESNSKSPCKTALDLMDYGNYQEAKSKLDKIIDDLQGKIESKAATPKDIEINNKAKVYKGICLLNLQRKLDAVAIFKESASSNDFLFPYHKGLAYFYLGEYVQALDCFKNYKNGKERISRTILTGLTYIEILKLFVQDEASKSTNKKANYSGTQVDDLIKKFLNKSGNNLNENDIEIFIPTVKKEAINYLEDGIKEIENVIKEIEKEIDKINGKVISEDEKRELSRHHYNKGVAFFSLNNYEESINAFNTATDLDKGYSLAFNNKGNAYAKMENYGAALEAYTKAINTSNKKYSIAFNNRGIIYLNLKDYKESIDDFESAIKVNPSNYKAWTNEGIALFYQKKYGDAKKAFETALELNPEYVLANVYLSELLLYLGDPEHALILVNKAITLDRSNAISWKLRGQILTLLEGFGISYIDDLDTSKYEKDVKKVDKAIEALNKAIKFSEADKSLILWKAYAGYLSSFDPKSNTAPTSNDKNKTDAKTSHLNEIILKLKAFFKSKSTSPNDVNECSIPKESSSIEKFEDSTIQKSYSLIIQELESYCYTSSQSGGSLKYKHFFIEKLKQFIQLLSPERYPYFIPILLIILITVFIVSMIPSYEILLEIISFVISLPILVVISVFFLISIIAVLYDMKKISLIQKIDSRVRIYEEEAVRAYCLYLLGCIYYKVGDYFKAKNKLEECIKIGSRDIKKSASQLLDHISSNYIQSSWWAWWLSSPTYHWTKRIVFTFLSGGFIFLLLFHPFIYPILFKFIYLSQFKDFFTEANFTSNMTNYTTTLENLTETVTESPKLVQYNNTLIKSNEIFMNFDPSTVNNILYYVLVSIPIFILFSPHISKFTFKTPPVEIETKSPKDFEFNLHPCLMDDVVRRIDDIPD